MTRIGRSVGVVIVVIVAAAGCALPAAAQTTGGSTTTSTTPTSTPETTAPPSPPTGAAPSGGGVTAQSTCTASDAASYLAAIATANASGCGATTQVITIAASFTLTGTQGLYKNPSNQPLTINGNGFTIDGANSSRILTSRTASITTINNLTLTHGIDLPTTTGGAIRTDEGVVINGSTFTQNLAAGGGGAISVGDGNITVTNSTFTDNHSLDNGGALRSHRPADPTSAVPVATITGSTFQANTSIFRDGGAIYSDGDVFLINSTVTGNAVSTGGHGGGITAAGVNLAYSDVFGNQAAIPGNGSDLGIRHLNTPSGQVPGSVQTFGSVIFSDPTAGPICSFDFPPANGTSFGYNWMSDNSCFPGGSAVPAPTDAITTTDPQLAPLANNGGPTLTLLPAVASPLVDRIPLSACQTPPLATGITADQRGFTRPSGPGCDIGAVELTAPTVPTITPRFTG